LNSLDNVARYSATFTPSFLTMVGTTQSLLFESDVIILVPLGLNQQ